MSKRAAKVAAPGARRITLTGIMLVPDAHGRVRLLLEEKFQADTLSREIPPKGAPYRLNLDGDGHPTRDGDGAYGTVWFVPPAHRKAHWLAVAADARGKPVKVEATVRAWTFEATGETGVSLDISLISL